MNSFLKFALCTGPLLWGGCRETKIVKPDAKGSPYEVFIVMDNEKWQGELGDTLRNILQEKIPTFDQPEPLFDVLSVEPYSFDELVQTHRNILLVKTGIQYPAPEMTVEHDTYAKPQLMVTIVAPNDSMLLNYVSTNRVALQKTFNIAERERLIARTEKFPAEKLIAQIQQKFGFHLSVPQRFNLRKEEPDFLWLSSELPTTSQGIVIYSYPYTAYDRFTGEALLEKRNLFVNKYIPGPSNGSYMTTSTEANLWVKPVQINERLWFELRGFWKISGDSRGGPFVSYTTPDPASDRVITLDFYFFSPKFGQRNYMRQLENLIFTVRFSDENTAK